MSENIVVYKNFDITPKILGIFETKNVLLSIALGLPLIYLVYQSTLSISFKIYLTFAIAFPLFLLNIVFSETDDIFFNIIIVLKYIFSTKLYLYNNTDK